MIISKKQQKRIEKLYAEFKKTSTEVFPLSETAFPGVHVFFGRKPKQVLFPFGKIEETEVFIGTDAEEGSDIKNEPQAVL